MAVDIGGTLTKVAFFLPSGSDGATNRKELERLETITSDCIPSKSNSLIYFLLMFSVELANGDRIEIRGFGTFTVKQRDARIARNPKTNTSVKLEERSVPYFRAGKELKDRLNSGA